MLRKAGLCLAIMAGLTGCNHLVPLTSTEAYDVAPCTYIGTFEEINNPGQVSFGTLKHYLDTTGVEFRVKRRAYASGATHLVWLYNHSEAAGALAYQCPADAPLDTNRLAALDAVSPERR